MKRFIETHFLRLKQTEKVWLRRTAGVLLMIGGMLGFLPVLGYWMFPVGLALLAVDIPWARRWYRRMYVAWGRVLGQKLRRLENWWAAKRRKDQPPPSG